MNTRRTKGRSVVLALDCLTPCLLEIGRQDHVSAIDGAKDQPKDFERSAQRHAPVLAHCLQTGSLANRRNFGRRDLLRSRDVCEARDWSVVSRADRRKLDAQSSRSTSGLMLILLVMVWKMSRFSLRLGFGNSIFLSNRPGRSKAGSSVSARLVAMMTLTFEPWSKPSICVRSSMRMRWTSRSAPVWASKRFVAIASTCARPTKHQSKF